MIFGVTIILKTKVGRDKTRSAEECLNKIRPYLKDIIKKLKKTDT